MNIDDKINFDFTYDKINKCGVIIAYKEGNKETVFGKVELHYMKKINMYYVCNLISYVKNVGVGTSLIKKLISLLDEPEFSGGMYGYIESNALGFYKKIEHLGVEMVKDSSIPSLIVDKFIIKKAE